MSKSDNRKFKICHLQEITIDSGSKTIENYYATFSQKSDTVVVYKTAIDDENSFENKYQYTFEKNATNLNSIVFVSKEENQPAEKLKITFAKNKVLINEDVYEVNDAYFKFLKQKVLSEKSILEIVTLTQDGLGDYATILEPLNKNWNKTTTSQNFKIISITTKNKNNQTDNQYFQKQVAYTYDKSRNLQKVEGESFKKIKVGETAKFNEYKISKNDERTASEIELYQNKKTLLDSVSVKWEQYSTAKKYSYIKYQSKLKMKQINQKPSSNNITQFF